ncbi:MAG: hypothetical protein CMB37_02475 [Euryarchaeota archaeon]|nr:hypothetical protein [Euryarchaeota archaeon]MEC7703974.1 hypothetical protein [Candidatus Thermoplasmatota archaeon]MED5486118.1 hypothetical protein [Candidatus Thermoplasmatota archaeon]
MSGSWISDRPEAEEHPVVPLGINEMTVPRISIVISFATIFMLIISGIWLGIASVGFLNQFEGAFAAVAEEDIQVDGRWTWEATLLFDDTCESRNGDWNWPNNLAEQDEVFWFPGELLCQWNHQGVGDYAHLAIHNVDENRDLPLSIEINHASISMDGNGQSMVTSIAAGDAVIIPIRLEAMVEETLFTIEVVHVSLPSAKVSLDVDLFSDGTDRDRHARNERMNVAYTVYDADSDEELDSGLLTATAGEDPMCNTPVPWVCYIEGFGWGLVGLDADMEESLTMEGTHHTILLPPDLAYGNSEGHELQNTWLRFRLELEQLLI